MPSSWVLATTGYAAAWPLGERATSAASSRRKSTSSSASTWTPVSAAVANASSASSGSRTVHTPRPSYPPRVTLSTHGSPNSSTSAADVTTAYRGHGTPIAVSRARITALSWACTSASGPGPYGDAGFGERVQVLGRHVLVVEGDDLCPAGDLPQHLEVAVVADDRVGDDLRRRDTLRLGQQPQRDPERRSRLRQHPRELPPTDDGDGGREVGHGATLDVRTRPRGTGACLRTAGRACRDCRAGAPELFAATRYPSV